MPGGVRRIGGALVALALTAACSGGAKPDMVIGSTRGSTTTALPGGTIPVDTAAPAPAVPPAVPAPAPPSAGATPGPPAVDFSMKNPDGHPYAGALSFRSSVPVSPDLTFVLVVGSDARPGEDIRRTNGDSIHLLAVNPRTGQGTLLGLPRDSYVQIPGRGQGKINSALASGGPALLADTVRALTGLPVQYYVLTGFGGLASMVDDLGGIDVMVDQRMNDAASGARFERGWHHFNGAQALAFARNRKDTANGDFSRSVNQGTLILAALAKMRAEVGDEAGLRRWIGVLLRHSVLDVAPDRLLGLASLARGLEPGRLQNVVAPGRVGMAGRQSVVYLGEEAARLFVDLRDDAAVNGGGGTPASPPPPAPASPPPPAPGPPPPPAAPPDTRPPLVTIPRLLP
ncbi:MAG: LCP family protein [Acidimicrobiales bacterium]